MKARPIWVMGTKRPTSIAIVKETAKLIVKLTQLIVDEAKNAPAKERAKEIGGLQARL